jgi:hypothetical protein
MGVLFVVLWAVIALGTLSRPVPSRVLLQVEDPPPVPLWATGVLYSISEIVNYQGSWYQCLQTHTAQPEWTPDVSESLWKAIPTPWDSHNAVYVIGKCVSYNDGYFVAIQNHTSQIDWTPDVTSLWTPVPACP